MATQAIPSVSQRLKLLAVIEAAHNALHVASNGYLFCSADGAAFVDAVADLTEEDSMFELADTVRRECGLDAERVTIPTLHPITVKPVRYGG